MRIKPTKTDLILLCCALLVAACLLWYFWKPSAWKFQCKLEAIAARGRPEDVYAIAEYLEDNTKMDSAGYLCGGWPITRAEMALQVLSGMDNPEVFDVVLPLLESEDPDVRYSAIGALGNQHDLRVVEKLGAIVLDEEERRDIRNNAAYVLEKIDKAESSPLVLVGVLARESDETFHRSGAYMRLAIIANAEPPLDSAQTVASAVEFWRNWWEENKALSPLDWQVRAFKQEFKDFPDLGDDNLIPALVRAARESVRRPAVRAAVRIFKAITSHIVYSDVVRNDPSEYERWYEMNKDWVIWDSDLREYRHPADVLEKIDDKRAVHLLIKALKSRDSCCRSHAAEALGMIGDKRAVGPVIEALRDRDWAVRRSAAWALGEIGDRRAVEPLIETLKDKESCVRRSAAEALGEIGDKKAVAPLRELWENDKDKWVRLGVAYALASIVKDEEVLEYLIRLLHDKDICLRQRAIYALESVVCEKAVETLITILKDDPALRFSASEALKKITNQDFGEDYDKWKQWYEKNKDK